jgi:O-antigen ligase
VGSLCVFATLTIWLDASYAERGFEAAILIATAVVLMVRGPFPIRPILVALCCVGLWGPLQFIAGWSVYRYETSLATLRWVTLIATFFLAYRALADRKVRERARTALALFAALLAVFATLQAFTSHGDYFWLYPSGQTEVFGPFQNRNNYAAFIELTIPLTLWAALKAGGQRTLWLALAGVMAASVIACGSRAGSALVALEIPAVFAAAFLSKQFRNRQVAIASSTMAIVAALCIAAAGWETLAHKLADLDPLLDRREMLQSAIAMVVDRPRTGLGWGHFQPCILPMRCLTAVTL